jgi:Raf kinase inhibitor-like YbhB/YbcL family protein
MNPEAPVTPIFFTLGYAPPAPELAIMSVPAAVSILIALGASLMQVASTDFALRSSAFSNHGTIPRVFAYSGFGCPGRNVSPPLEWTPGPAGTKSYALTTFDPDARPPVGFWHWIAFNIPKNVTKLPPNAGVGNGARLPQGTVQGRNDFQQVGWGGPCPPQGPAHRYVFTLYALDVEQLSGVSELTSGPDLLKAMKGHILAQAQLVGRFAR